MMLDRKYSPSEVAEIAARGSSAMEQQGTVPGIVVLTAHVAAANALMGHVVAIGPLSPDFQRAALALHAVATLFLLVCETGPVSGGKES
jgi:hypothetical protein